MCIRDSYNALSGEVRAAIADLAALKYEVLQKVGDAVGNLVVDLVLYVIRRIDIIMYEFRFMQN